MTGCVPAAVLAAAVLAVPVFSVPASAQKAGGVLRAYNFDNPPSASIHEEATISTAQPFMSVFNNLVLFDQQAKRNTLEGIKPDLATEWSWSPDNTQLTFKLREGVKWHDGKPFTSADVKCTWDTLTEKREAGWRKNPRKGWYFNLEEVTTKGDHEVTFRLGRPQPSFLAFLAGAFSPVYPCHVNGRDMRQTPIGTGPFKVVTFKPNDTVTLARNPDYWKPGRPYLDGIEWKIVRNRATRILAFVTGEFDITFTQDVTVAIEKDIKSQRPDVHCEMNPTNSQGQLLINREAEPFNNEKIRRAMLLAIDRKAFIDVMSEGTFAMGGALQAPPEGQWGLAPEQLADLPGYGDVEKSREEGRRLMRELGYGPDKPLKIKVTTRNVAIYHTPAVLLTDHLKHVFIEGEVDMTETAVWYPKLTTGKFSVAWNGAGISVDDPDVVFYENYACGSERNYSNYCNKDLQAKFDQQSAMTDVDARKKLVNEIDRELQLDGARPIIFQTKAGMCWHNHLKGITVGENSQYNNWRMEDAWLDK